MISLAHRQHKNPKSDWHDGFLSLLPAIQRHAHLAFYNYRGEAKEDAICEVVANCLCAYRRLYERNELQRAFASTLVRYAVAMYHRGRRVGTSQSSRDLYSIHTRLKAGIQIQSCSTSRDERAEWMECLVDNRRTSIPDQAHFRVEFPRWLKTKTKRDRQMVERLSLGYSTHEVARKFKISASRVSQLRREYYDSWNTFSS